MRHPWRYQIPKMGTWRRRDCDSIIKDLETENSVAKLAAEMFYSTEKSVQINIGMEKVNFHVSKLNNSNLSASKYSIVYCSIVMNFMTIMTLMKTY